MSTEVLATEGLLERKLMLKQVNGCCGDDIVRQCILDLALCVLSLAKLQGNK